MAAQPHPWLMPLHRRVLTMVVAVAWLGFEAWVEPSGMWFWLAAGITVYGVYDFFLSGSYPTGGAAPPAPPAAQP